LVGQHSEEWLKDLLEEEKVVVQERYLDSAVRSIREWCKGNM